MEFWDDEGEDYSPDYCSNNRVSPDPEMEMKVVVSHRNSAKNGFANPRIKRRLGFDADRRSDKQFRSKDVTFCDLEPVLCEILTAK